VSDFVEGIRLLLENSDEALVLLREHLALVLVSELAALSLAIPAAILAVRNDRAKSVILSFGNAAQTIPTIAILFLAFPIMGLGFWPSIVGLWAYAILPIIVNTIKGIENVDEGTVEAARGMGMTDWEILKSIQLPLALPVIFAGIRTSTVLVIGTAYLAIFIGGGGLGYWVVAGIQGYNVPMIVAGALPGALLAIGADLALARIERLLGGEGGVGDTSIAA
jgi:osmoprotectant transport system permease protein